MSELDTLREDINEIDRQMAQLFEQRMGVCEKIAAAKQKDGLPVRDQEREAKILERNREWILDDDIRSYYIRFLRSVIDISCSYQEMRMSGMSTAYSGVEGAFAYIAAKKLFPTARLHSFPDFGDAYRSVERGENDCAVLPLENSEAGEVAAVTDLMYTGSLCINAILDLPVRHQLLGIPGSDRKEIRTVISHPHALKQCSNYLDRHDTDTKTAKNTAAAARRVLQAQDPSVGAIASEETAALYGLDVLDEDIQNTSTNTTRFGVFSRNLRKPADPAAKDENFILMFTVKNEAGALASTLNIIGAHGFNMRSLRSRPMKDLPWSYYFTVEAEGNIHTQNGEAMMRELSALCEGLKLVGTYR